MDRPNVLVLLFDTLRADAVTRGEDVSSEHVKKQRRDLVYHA